MYDVASRMRTGCVERPARATHVVQTNVHSTLNPRTSAPDLNLSLTPTLTLIT